MPREMPVVALFKATSSDEAGDDRYVKILKSHDYAGVLIPTLAFKFELCELKSCLLRQESYAGLILTSPRSVDCIGEAMDKSVLDHWQEKRLYCVGEATRLAAAQMFPLSRLVCSENGNAQHLSSLILDDHKRTPSELPLLFPCSSLRMDTIPTTLTQKNVRFEAIECYNTVPHPHLKESIMKLANQNPGYLVFFSPSGVKYTFTRLSKYNLFRGAKVISIGNTTAKTLADVGIEISRVCAKPTPESLVEALNLC